MKRATEEEVQMTRI